MKRLMLLALATGCTQTNSEDILTSGMHASIGAQATGNGTTSVGATLYFGNPLDLNFVNLTSGDQLVATNGGHDSVMTESNILNIISYSTTFQTDAADEQFVVALHRTVDAGAPNSTLTLPAPFSLTAPPTSSSRAAELAVAWAPSGSADLMSARVTGICIDDASFPVTGDPGSLTIPAGMLKKKVAAGTADSCEATLEVSRSRQGDADPHYGKGADIAGLQVRTATFTTAP